MTALREGMTGDVLVKSHCRSPMLAGCSPLVGDFGDAIPSFVVSARRLPVVGFCLYLEFIECFHIVGFYEAA
jgi:hypothetical protein